MQHESDRGFHRGLKRMLSTLRPVVPWLAAAALGPGGLPASAMPDVSIEAWGNNSSGQCTPPGVLEPSADIVAVAGGNSHSIACLGDGSVVTWGSGYGADTNWFPEGLSDVEAIAAGYDHNLALKSDGTVVAWGLDNYLQCTAVDGMSNVAVIAAGNYNSVVMQADGTVVGRGQYINYTLDAYASNTVEIIALASGVSQDFALRADGTVTDLRGGYVPDGLNNVKAIAAGSAHGVALQSNGMVVAWNSPVAVPEDLTNAVAVTAKGYRTMALKSDGSVVGWGWEYYGENTPPEGLSNVVAIAAGFYHSLALVGSGSEPAPMLQVTGSVDRVTLSWDPVPPGFILQQADTLTTNTLWSDAASGAANPVEIPATEPALFFRLRKP